MGGYRNGSGGGGMNRSKLPKNEWDLLQFLKDKPVWAEVWCWEWEFTRTFHKENPSFQEAVSNWRRGKQQDNGFYEDPFSVALALSEELAALFRVLCFPSWPDAPFGSITKVEWDLLDRGESKSLQELTPSCVKDIDRLPDGEVVLGPEGTSVLIWEDCIAWVNLQVDWVYQTDAEVMASLGRWLEAARGTLGKQPFPREYNNESRTRKKQLKALGGYRLRKKHENQTQVIVNSAGMFPDAKAVTSAIAEVESVFKKLREKVEKATEEAKPV